MTENEAIEILREKYMDIEYYFAEHDCYREEYDAEFQEAIAAAMKALKEIQQYRAIGTVEECREARERLMAKKPIMKNDDEIECDSGKSLYCPACGVALTDRIPFDNKDFYFHCLNCGQKLDWSDTP